MIPLMIQSVAEERLAEARAEAAAWRRASNARRARASGSAGRLAWLRAARPISQSRRVPGVLRLLRSGSR